MAARRKKRKLKLRNPHALTANKRKAGSFSDKRRGKRAEQAAEKRQEEETHDDP
jgi:hypothetical protein